MNNSDEILKRILLNMKYDSRKTLRENRVILEQPKKPKITIDPLEKIEQGQDVTYKDAIGGELILPKNAKILRYIQKQQYELGINNIAYIQKSFPIFTQMCKSNNVKDVNKCITEGYTHWVNLLSNEFGVVQFSIDDKIYKACFTKMRNGKLILPTESNFDGYYTGEPKNMGECGREKWINNESNKQGEGKGSNDTPIGTKDGDTDFVDSVIALDLEL